MAEVPAFDLSLKKKKKKKVTKDVEEVTEEVAELEVKDEKEAEPVEGEAPDSFDFGTKKKKKSSSKKKEKAAAEEPAGDEAPEDASSAEPVEFDGKEGSIPWAGSDRDYTYEELAGRVYSLMHTNNQDTDLGGKRIKIKPPQVVRDGTKKTVWLNFAEMCPVLKRKPEHVLNYVLAELGTNGSVDGKHRLVIKGRFQPKQIETVVRHYISEYVACRTCKSADTTLKKENRLYFLCCEACGSTRSVVAIKKGFEAQVGKRKKDKV